MAEHALPPTLPAQAGDAATLIGQLVAQERDFVQKAQALLESLSELDVKTADRGTLRQSLSALSDGLEEVGALAGTLPCAVSAFDAQTIHASLGSTLETWGRVSRAVDGLVVRVLQGRVPKSLQLLSPIANAANLGGRRRILLVRERYAGLAARATSAFRVPETRETKETKVVTPKPEVSPVPADKVPDAVAPAPVDSDKPIKGPSPGKAESFDYPAVFADAPSSAQPSFEECLVRLSGPDELERNDALIELLRRYQHELVVSLIRGAAAQEPSCETVMRALWQHAELVLLDDYFYSMRRTKLTSFLSLADPYTTAPLFRTLVSLFRPPDGGYAESGVTVAGIEASHPGELGVFLRSLTVHPLESYRRQVVARLTPADFWGIVSFPATPPAALLCILERLTQPDAADDDRRVFFDCTLRTLAVVRDELHMRAVRRILDILFTFDFFMEDDYFKKLLALDTVIEQVEKRLGVRSALLDESLRLLKEQKQRVGARPTRIPTFAGIPITVQRKLAREGQYPLLFVRSPDTRVAKESLPFVSTPGRAEQVAGMRDVDRQVLEALARKPELFKTQTSRMALLKNPHASLAAAQRYAPNMDSRDLEPIAVSRDANSEIAQYLKGVLARRRAQTAR